MWKLIREALPEIIGGLVVVAVLGVIAWLNAALKGATPFLKGGKWTWKEPRWLRWVLGAVVVIALLTVGYHFYNQAQPPTKIIILVANFDGPEPQEYRVTETVREQLSLAAEKYDDVKVQYVKRAFENSLSARSEGEKHKATIVIWGWYGVTEEAVLLSVHFDLLRPPKDMPELGPNLKGGVQTVTIGELESITLQSRLAAAMTSLSLFTVGMTRYAVQDWQGAIALFDDALRQSAEHMPDLDWGIYFYRGNAHLFRDDFDQAVDDYTESIELRDDVAEAYNNRGIAYYHKGAHEKAIADYNRAIELRHNYAEAFNNRSVAYYDEGDYNQAIADCSEAIELKDKYATAYCSCGNAYAALGKYNQAITHYDEAIKLEPKYAKAYNNRGTVYILMGEYDQAIADCSEAVKWNPGYARAYYCRGTAHKLKDEKEEAIKYFEWVLELSEDEELSKNAEKQLRDLGRE